MNIVIGDYRISPYRGNTCWKIEERSESENSEVEWKESRYYPNTLAGALKKARELSQKTLSKKDDLTVKAAIEQVEALDAKFLKAIAEITKNNCTDYAD